MNSPFRLLEECASTNDEAKRWAAEGAPHGAWVQAKRQTHGRGRQGRIWLGGEGNLFLSVILRLDGFSQFTWLPLMTAISAVQAMQFEVPDLPFRIKWPNDVWLNDGKLGGVLCESAGGVVVAGVGLNLAEKPRGELLYPVTALSEQSGRSHSPEVLAARTAWNLVQAVHSVPSRGTIEIQEFYDRHAQFPVGTAVSWADQEGEVLGLGPAGELRVRVQGFERSLYAEDVSGVTVPRSR